MSPRAISDRRRDIARGARVLATLPSAANTDSVRDAEAYRRFVQNPAHPSLHLERLRADPRAWSVRVTRNYRAVTLRQVMSGCGFGSAHTTSSTDAFQHKVLRLLWLRLCSILL